jgi:glycosyltransferase involved in cell wall biosynthesis
MSWLRNAAKRSMTASIVITTKSRKEELRRALASCVEQEPPVEIVIIDDGSADGTSEIVRTEFPHVRLFQSDESKGYIVQRNRGAEMATGDLIFSLDDDAEFSSPHVVRQTLAAFDDPRIGAVTIPWKNVPDHQTLSDKAPQDEGVFVCRSYTGMAHAVRRDLFLRLGGYREFLLHGSEEIDFCMRLLDAGYVVRLGRADHVNHYESKVRNVSRQAHFAARNAVLFAWYNAPGLRLPIHWAGTVVHVLLYGLKNGYLWPRFRGLADGFASCAKQRQARCPVSLTSYRLYRRLTRRGFLAISDMDRIPRVKEKPSRVEHEAA